METQVIYSGSTMTKGMKPFIMMIVSFLLLVSVAQATTLTTGLKYFLPFTDNSTADAVGFLENSWDDVCMDGLPYQGFVGEGMPTCGQTYAGSTLLDAAWADSNAFSLCFWSNVSDTDIDLAYDIASFGTLLRYDNAPVTGLIQFDDLFDGGDHFYNTSADTVVLGTWKHICVTRNESFYLHVYYDGVEVIAAQTDGAITDTDPEVSFTHGSSGSSGMDEIGVWTRDLSSDEVTELYSCGLNQSTYPFSCGAPANTPPTVTILSPANNSNFTTDDSIYFSMNVSDDDGDNVTCAGIVNPENDTVMSSFFSDGSPFFPYRVVNESASYSAGNHTWYVVCTDGIDPVIVPGVDALRFTVTQAEEGQTAIEAYGQTAQSTGAVAIGLLFITFLVGSVAAPAINKKYLPYVQSIVFKVIIIGLGIGLLVLLLTQS